MSRTVRKVKTKTRKVTIEKILKNRKKRIRLYLLTAGILFLTLGFFLSGSFSQPQEAKEAKVVEEVPSEVISFSQEPFSIDKSFIEVTKVKKTKKKTQEKDPPIRILIPKLDIDLEVKEAKVIDGYWEVFPSTAGFGLGSSYPEEKGNQVIFAHAREGLFLPLKQANLGQSIYVFTKDKWFRYEISEIREVTPDQKEVIAPTKETILTLYTCTGFSDSKRLIVIAKKS